MGQGGDMECGWNNGSKGVISYVRVQLLAAFQDLRTITNEIEIHGIILREVLEQRKMFSTRYGGDRTAICQRKAVTLLTLRGSSISDVLSRMQLHFYTYM